MSTLLHKAIYNNSLDQALDVLDHNKYFPDKEDFLSYPISQGNNDMVSVLVASGKINLRANENIALEVARESSNEHAIKLLNKVFSKPSLVALLKLPFDELKGKTPSTLKVYSYSRTSTLFREIKKRVKLPFGIYVKGVPLSSDETNSDDLLLDFLKARSAENVVDLNINVCIVVGGEIYPPPNHRRVVLASMVPYLDIEDIKAIYEDPKDRIDNTGLLEALVKFGKSYDWINIDARTIIQLYNCVLMEKSISVEEFLNIKNIDFAHVLGLARISTSKFATRTMLDADTSFYVFSTCIKHVAEKWPHFAVIDGESLAKVCNDRETEVLVSAGVISDIKESQIDSNIRKEWIQHVLNADKDVDVWSASAASIYTKSNV